MISVNPHEGRFEPIDKLPRINSKYKNSFKVSMNKTLGRNEISEKIGNHHGNHVVTI